MLWMIDPPLLVWLYKLIVDSTRAFDEFMEHFVTPFLGIPFPMQAAPAPTSENSSKPKHGSKHSLRKNSRKRRKLSGMKRIAATTRERSRIEHLNCAFITLRSRIPTQPTDVKLTKVETLRLAMSYIMHLERLVGEFKENDRCTGSSEVSSTSGPGSKDISRSEQLACPRAVRVYPAPYPTPPDHLEYHSWAHHYTGTHPVRPIPTTSLDIPFIMKKDEK